MRLWRQCEDFNFPLSAQEMRRDGRGLEQQCPVGAEKCFIYLDGQKSSFPTVFFGSSIFGLAG